MNKSIDNWVDNKQIEIDCSFMQVYIDIGSFDSALKRFGRVYEGLYNQYKKSIESGNEKKKETLRKRLLGLEETHEFILNNKYKEVM